MVEQNREKRPANKPLVYIVVLNWNGLEDTRRCILSLLELTYENYMIIVIDNGSSGDEAEKLLQDFWGRIVLIRNSRNLGYSKANNQGMKRALIEGAEYVLLLNNDTVVHPECLDLLVAASSRDNRIGLAGPTMYLLDKPDTLWYAGGKLSSYSINLQVGKGRRAVFFTKGHVTDTDYIPGACLLIRRAVIERIGLLSLHYFLGWEDIDYCIRARKNGFRCVYVPSAVIWHKVSATFRLHGLSYLQVYYAYKNRIILRALNLSPLAFTAFMIVNMLVLMPSQVFLYAFVYRDIRRARSAILGSKDGLFWFRWSRSRPATQGA